MIDWIVTSSLLIVIIIVLRAILKGRIGLRLQYGLWLLVLIRLLVPLSLPSQLSVLNLLPKDNAQVFEQPLTYVAYDPDSLPDLSRPEVDPALPEEQQQNQYQQALQEYEQTINEAKAQTGIAVSWSTVLYAIWIVGMVAIAAILLISNFRFDKQLRKTEIDTVTIGCHLPTYISDAVATPCLFGLFRPRIYLTFESVKNKNLKQYVVTHELAHYHHKDHIWSALRVLCLLLHWYNPLVWIAAILSKQDAELCCDETAIQFLGEAQRQNYGKALIEMSCVKKDMKSLFITATTMIGSKKALKERIILIAKHPRTALLTLIVVILVACIAVGCTFTGQQAESTEPSTEPSAESTEPSSAPTGYPEGEVQFTLAYVNGQAYIHDSTWNPGAPLPDGFVRDGSIVTEDNKNVPSTERAACHIAPGTPIYTKAENDTYVFYWCEPQEDNYPRRMIRLDQTDFTVELLQPSVSETIIAEPINYPEDEVPTAMVRLNGILYIRDITYSPTDTLPENYKSAGIVRHTYNYAIPVEERNAAHMDIGTVLYTNAADTTYIFYWRYPQNRHQPQRMIQYDLCGYPLDYTGTPEPEKDYSIPVSYTKWRLQPCCVMVNGLMYAPEEDPLQLSQLPADTIFCGSVTASETHPLKNLEGYEIPTGSEVYIDSDLSYAQVYCKMPTTKSFTVVKMVPYVLSTTPALEVFDPPTITNLPSEYTLSTLVSTYAEHSGEWSNQQSTYAYSYSIPEIYPFSTDAVTVQAYIHYEFGTMVANGMDAASHNAWPNVHNISYQCSLNDDILSVVITVHTPTDAVLYHVFVFDLNTGKLLNNHALLEKLGISQQEYLTIARPKAEQAHRDFHANLTDADKDEFYQQQLAATVTDENLNSAQVYLNADGDPVMILRLFPVAGAASYQVPIPLF